VAKIKHNNSYDTYKLILDQAKSNNLIQLQDSSNFCGTKYRVNDRDLLNFGYCGYLGLEMHKALKNGATDFVNRYGLQYGISRAYMTSKPEKELLELLSEMYGGQHIIIHSSTSSAHIGNIPNLISSEDAIILDQQVHFSVQTGAQLCRQNGTHIEMIRHLSLEMLERRYLELNQKYRRVWYLTDGVFSMYGDTLPCDEIRKMLDTHKNLYAYVDDAHGMSWRGETGGGFVYDAIGRHEKMILNTTMGKGFGVTGGISVFPTFEFYDRVKTFGGPLTYSHPLSPAIIGAATASAKLHLSPEFAIIQNELTQRIQYCHEMLTDAGLPLISDASSPIFFIGLGQPKVVFNMVTRLFDEGFYVNPALFPAVSVKNGGFRFSISLHNSIKDIEKLVEAIKQHYQPTLTSEGITDEKVRRAFKLPILNEVEETLVTRPQTEKKLEIEWFRSIKEINRDIWDSHFAGKGSFDWEGMLFLENVFIGNDEAVNHWDFHYLIISEDNQVQAATFFTVAHMKDDMFANAQVSAQVEQLRTHNSNYLVSKTLMMGSLLTEGRHLYLNETYKNRQKLLQTLVEEIDKLQADSRAETVIIRDLIENEELNRFFFDHGFVKLDLPNANTLNLEPFRTIDDYAKAMKSSRRRHFKKDVMSHYDEFVVSRPRRLSNKMQDHHFALLENVRTRNMDINFFPYPKKLLEQIAGDDQWEILALKVKGRRLPVATIWSYKGQRCFCPMLMGMDYDFLESHKLYKQCLYRVIESANYQGYRQLYLGFSADVEKRKLGAQQMPKVAYVRANDNFAIDIMASMAKIEMTQ